MLRCYRAIAERDRSAGERDRELERLARALAESDRRISDMRSTRAWRAATSYWRLRERL
jgi:hypothetical protein